MHKSLPQSPLNNERLEFLGDAILNLVIADFLMETFPKDLEGDLSKKRSQLVCGQTLWEVALELKLDQQLQVGPQVNPQEKRILSGAFEAYIGAIYKDSNLLTIQNILKKIFKTRVESSLFLQDYKSSLQEWCQKTYQTIPLYKIKKEEGPAHKKIFHVDVFIENNYKGSGADHQKKQAEQLAAKQALDKLKES
ncbi:MAG: ribonuclease III [Bdellovibrionales bacterium]